jgi:hypothetical protein
LTWVSAFAQARSPPKAEIGIHPHVFVRSSFAAFEQDERLAARCEKMMRGRAGRKAGERTRAHLDAMGSNPHRRAAREYVRPFLLDRVKVPSGACVARLHGAKPDADASEARAVADGTHHGANAGGAGEKSRSNLLR